MTWPWLENKSRASLWMSWHVRKLHRPQDKKGNVLFKLIKKCKKAWSSRRKLWFGIDRLVTKNKHHTELTYFSWKKWILVPHAFVDTNELIAELKSHRAYSVFILNGRQGLLGSCSEWFPWIIWHNSWEFKATPK